MTVKEFWEIIDAIDIDSREEARYTEDEMYKIGCSFIEMNNAQKREIGGWDRLVEILQPLDKNGDVMKKGDTFRQWVKGRRYSKDEMVHNEKMLSGATIDKISFVEFKDKTEKLKSELYKQEVKTRDVLNSYRKTLRSEARVESIKDLIERSVTALPPLPEVEPGVARISAEDSPAEAVMLLSDMHIGMTIDNFANTYNKEVARARLAAYVDEVITLCHANNVVRLNVCNLNDLVHGAIHLTARIEEEEDVITQIMLASEMLAEALNKLQAAAPEVIYRSVTDNHSRLMPSFKEHIEKESLARLIDFYVEPRLSGSSIIFAKDNLDYDISKIDLLNGKIMICAHGHRDNINTIIQGYMGALRQYVNYVCVGHYHETKMKGFQGAKVFVNGSLCGPDSFAISKRLFGDPEQTLLIFKGRTLSQHVISFADI